MRPNTARLAGEFIAALYSPGQARAPQGDPAGGQWVAEGAGGQMALETALARRRKRLCLS